jgi:hypothetical protein
MNIRDSIQESMMDAHLRRQVRFQRRISNVDDSHGQRCSLLASDIQSFLGFSHLLDHRVSDVTGSLC